MSNVEKTYAQLDFVVENNVKRVNLIGGLEVGIIPSLIERFPAEFIDLTGRVNVPLDSFDWWYIPANDLFVKTSDIPVQEPEVIDHEVVESEEGRKE